MPQQDVFTTNDTWEAPAGVTSVDVECWGAGGSGASGNGGTTDCLSGGGGGAYSRKNAITVVPGNSYTVVVGVGGTAVSNNTGNTGGDSYFIDVSTVLAKGGSGGGRGTSGTVTGANGGQASAGVGDVKYDGGDAGDLTGSSGGSGGGGGAGTTGAGGDSPDAGNGVQGAGGTGTSDGGGNGGAAAPTNLDVGVSGSTIGGGGGAGHRNATLDSGAGARGEVRINYGDIFTTDIEDTVTSTDSLQITTNRNIYPVETVNVSDSITASVEEPPLWTNQDKNTSNWVNQDKS